MKMLDYLIIGGVGYLILMMFKKPKPPVQTEIVEGFVATEKQINQASSASQLTTAMSGNAMNQPVTPTSADTLGSRNSSRTLAWR
tara:strand:- start:1120 stop:1374 length:255 start_codon:yes stop_codon:yes gene_type:complete